MSYKNQRGFLVCDQCGVLVIDVEIHDRWHGEVPDVPEVEVTESSLRNAYGDAGTLVPVPPQSLPEGRRSGAKNRSEPRYQQAFISEARASMGQPTEEDARDLVGYQVTMIFNVDLPPKSGVLTEVITHPAAPAYLVLDNNHDVRYPLNSIQELQKVR